ncbi:MAG: site-2 protease family protein [Methylovirgula sp.]
MSIYAHLASVAGTIVPFLFVLSVVVFFHELGHFLIGRLCGVKVDTFSLGFGPELAHFTDRWGTRWRLALLPLGGYVKFHGDANGASMTDDAASVAMPAAERKVTFFGQNVWKRAAIVVAGPIANFILAIVIFTGIFTIHGRGILLPEVEKNSAAAAAGFKPNDVSSRSTAGKVDSFEDVQRVVQASSGRALSFVVLRQGKVITLIATPQQRSGTPGRGPVDVWRAWRRGQGCPSQLAHPALRSPESFQLANNETWYYVELTGRLCARHDSRPRIDLAIVRADPNRGGFGRDGQGGIRSSP